ncbi:hypothetical protein SH1V18_19310 [Vallitalea longa]|uniref:Uncharacterized protein n=1 Tax=Vallitalea longa TaxID=2936439 RepID=A0A9W5YB62_9FIRM|nr:hypothetical protein [Vallitalea longa]GKX29451.1 hypothetical protein SH1V18_19310 [Vallitalea longa]
MNIDFSMLIQIILIALILYFIYFQIDTENSIKLFNYILLYDNIRLTHYLDYKTSLYLEDIESYHKYRIWIFYEKTKVIFN